MNDAATVSSTYDWAEFYLNRCIQEGVVEAETLYGKTEKELIDLALSLAHTAEVAAEGRKEDVL